MGYSDSHAHMADYQPDSLTKISGLMRENDIELVLSVSVNLDFAEKTIEIAKSHGNLAATVGIHPWFAVPLDDNTRRRFSELASSKYVKAIGEIGLDYMPPVMDKKPKDGGPEMPPPSEGMPKLPDTPPGPDIQKDLFKFELSEAVKHGLPVNIHCQNGAHKDMIEIVSKEVKSGLTGIVHSFDGGLREIKEWLDLGFYITLGAMIVIQEPHKDLNELVRAIPEDRLVTETDSNPMVSPVNGPVDVIKVVRKIAEIKNSPAEDIGRITTANLKRVLKIG